MIMNEPNISHPKGRHTLKLWSVLMDAHLLEIITYASDDTFIGSDLAKVDRIGHHSNASWRIQTSTLW